MTTLVMTFLQAVEYIRQRLPLEVLTAAINGGFICPSCGNGSGDDGTGFNLELAPDGKNYIGHCFRCNENFDTFKILGLHFGLDPTTDFKKLVEKSADLYGIEIVDERELRRRRKMKPDFKNVSDQETEFQEKQNPPPDENSCGTEETFSAEENKNFESEGSTSADDDSSPEQLNIEEGKYTRLIQSARLRLPKFVESHGGTWRGLTLETLNRFRVGFLPFFGKLGLPRVIIPTFSDNHYLARLVISEEERIRRKIPDTVREKPHFGTKDVFNFEEFQAATNDDTFFVTEGEIDAMSICQLGFKAIALAGSFVSKFQKTQIQSIKARPRIIILFDEDTAGLTNRGTVAKVFKKLGFNTEIASLQLQRTDPITYEVTRFKDPNDVLQADPKKLADRLQEIFNLTKETFDRKENQQAFEDEVRQTVEFDLTSKQIFPDCPVDVHIPAGYHVDRLGIRKVFKSAIGETFCGMPVFVSKIFVTPEREEAKVELVYLNRRNNTWYNKTCRMSAIKDPKQILRMDEFIVDSGGCTRLSTYLIKMIADEANEGRIQEKKFFTKTGWLQDDCTEFVLPTDINGAYPVLREGFDFASAFKTHGRIEDSTDIFSTLIYNNTATRITLGSVFAAPLVKLLGCRNSQLHLYAKSGSGKSAVIKVGFSAFMDPTPARQTFGSTMKYLLDFPAKFDGLATWVDELQSVDNFTRMHLDDFIYNYENGLTRGRLDKNADEKPRKLFSGVRITSGEQPITSVGSGQGAKNRVLELDCTNMISDKIARKIHKMFSSSTRASYGHFGRRYIAFISQPKSRVLLENYFYKVVDDIRTRAAMANGWNPAKQNFDPDQIPDALVGLIPAHVQMLALFLTGLHFFEQILWQGDKNQIDAADELLERDLDFIIKNFNQSRLTSNGERTLDDLVDFIKSEDKGFRHQTNDGTRIYAQEVGIAAHGIKFADGSVGITRSALKNLIKTHFDSRFHIDALIDEWSDLDVFIEGNAKSHPHQKFVRYDTEPGIEDNDWFYLVRKDVRSHVEQIKKSRLAALAAS